MQHGGDFSSFYAPQYQAPPPNPNPHPNSGEFAPSYPVQQSFASAPPYSTEFQAYCAPASGGSYPQTPETAHNVPQSQLPPPAPQFASVPAYNPYPYQPDPSPPPPVYPHQQPSSVPHPYDAPPANPSPSSNPSSIFYPTFSSYNVPYEDPAGRSGQETGYFNDNSGSYDASVTGGYSRGGSSSYGSGFSEANPYDGMSYDEFGVQTNGLGDGVYRYDGGRSEPYGARGTSPTRSSTLFDDYGRSISLPSGGNDLGGGSKKIVKAVPKVEVQQDVKNGVQKFRVRLLPEGSGQSSMDVLCQIGLDGIRMLDPSTNRILRVYFLENIIRCEVSDSSTFTFWSKTSVDIDPRRIRLQSNSHTTNILLDAVTAATVQLKEIDGTDSMTRGGGTTEANRVTDQSAERKKGLVDWVNLIKPSNEEKDHWVPDEAVTKCTSCGSDFGAFNRRHHCRNCGDIFCDKCTKGRIALTADENAQQVRVCDRCMAEVSQRLSNTNEAASKRATLHTHEHLAQKIQEEMDKNRKSGKSLLHCKTLNHVIRCNHIILSLLFTNSTDDGKRMREVACPICTVHLQVQVPASGSETIECGVCQHPFLVSAH